MNEIEFVVDVRQSPDSSELIVVKQKMAISGEAHPVGPPIETRYGLPKRQAEVKPFGFADIYTKMGLGASVKNIGKVPFEVDQVALVHEFEKPQDSRLVTKVRLQEVGGSVILVPRDPAKKGPLHPGEKREYILPQEMYDGTTLLVIGLSPRCYWIAVFSGGEEVGRIGGEFIRPFLTFGTLQINRRARPAFDTLSEGERMAIITAVAPLREKDSDQWTSDTVRPLDGAPNAFGVRASNDLLALVTQTKDRGVEIVDIVRADALDQSAQPVGAEGGKP